MLLIIGHAGYVGPSANFNIRKRAGGGGDGVDDDDDDDDNTIPTVMNLFRKNFEHFLV